MRFFFFFFLIALVAPTADAHSRWICPEPRSSSTGIKYGPCGGDTNDLSGNPVEISPGLMRVRFEESIDHRGAPWRISLSQEGTDTEGDSCILLDHIPHNDLSNPDRDDPSTWTPYYITIDIPDVDCERCSLHMSNPMTDKISSNGSPNGAGCTDPGTCNSVYHSCTVPLRILGTIPRQDYQCPDLPSDWPTVWDGDGGLKVDASVPQLYRRESGTWEDSVLMNVPERYRLDAGELCGSGEVLTPPPTVVVCVSGSMTVELQDGSFKTMNDVQVGEWVRVGPAGDAFEPIYGFGHADKMVMAEYILLTTSRGERTLEISADHMLFTHDDVAVPASTLKVGEVLADGDFVSSVKRVIRQGAYAPFTASGTIVVNGIKISNYISFQKHASHLTVAGMTTPFSFHWLAYSFLTVHRYFGTTTGIDMAHAASRWWLSQSPVIVLLILLPVATVLMMLTVLETILLRPCMAALVLLALPRRLRRRRKEKTL